MASNKKTTICLVSLLDDMDSLSSDQAYCLMTCHTVYVFVFRAAEPECPIEHRLFIMIYAFLILSIRALIYIEETRTVVIITARDQSHA